MDDIKGDIVKHEVLKPEEKYCCNQMNMAIEYGNIEKPGLYFFIRVPSGYDEGYGSLGIEFCPFCGEFIYPLKNPDTGEVYYKWDKKGV